jgi:hypothetical protein
MRGFDGDTHRVVLHQRICDLCADRQRMARGEWAFKGAFLPPSATSE